MENYLIEAFQKLSLLKEDDFDITADRDVVDELQSFVADDVEEIPEEPVIDLDAESDEDLADNYVGKVILECACCHTRIYKDESEVVVDEESELANIDEACPVCNNAMGYTVIGKIEKFDDEPEEVEDDEIDFSDAENDPADEEPVESLRDRIKRKRESLKEAKDVCPECGKNPCVCEKCEEDESLEEDSVNEAELSPMDRLRKKYGGQVKAESIEEDIDRTLDVDTENNLPPHSEFQTEDSARLEDMEDDPVLTEGIENLSMDTDDTHVEMTSTEDGGATVTVEPKDEFPEDDAANLGPGFEGPGFEDLGGEEEIVPLSSEEQDDILDNEPEGEEEAGDLDMDDLGDLDFEEEEPAEGEEEEDEEEELPEESLKSNSGEKINESEEFEEDADDYFLVPGDKSVGEALDKGEPTADTDELIDDFDDDAFNDLAESFLRRVYDNVNTFITTAARDSGDKFIVEGIIKYKNDKMAKTSFVFTEANETRSGKIVLEGYNETFSKQPKSFKIRGKLDNHNYIAESMLYHYTVRSLNEGKVERTKVQGRVKVKK